MVDLPLWKVLVSWDDSSQYMESPKSRVWNHQPVFVWIFPLWYDHSILITDLMRIKPLRNSLCWIYIDYISGIQNQASPYYLKDLKSESSTQFTHNLSPPEASHHPQTWSECFSSGSVAVSCAQHRSNFPNPPPVTSLWCVTGMVFMASIAWCLQVILSLP